MPEKKNTEDQKPQPKDDNLIASQKGEDGTNEWELRIMPGGIIGLSFKDDKKKPTRRRTRKK
ncbi:MAG: hypothetical protein LUC43_00805 [Burkholderiales bacterium]|nr:hypothetical protein [Burkholderiales bacterium]